jgi:hypothetical protein
LCVGAKRASERVRVRVRVDKGGYAYDERGRRSAHASCFVKGDCCGARATADVTVTVAITRQYKSWKLPASQQTAKENNKRTTRSGVEKQCAGDKDPR